MHLQRKAGGISSGWIQYAHNHKVRHLSICHHSHQSTSHLHVCNSPWDLHPSNQAPLLLAKCLQLFIDHQKWPCTTTYLGFYSSCSWPISVHKGKIKKTMRGQWPTLLLCAACIAHQKSKMENRHGGSLGRKEAGAQPGSGA